MQSMTRSVSLNLSALNQRIKKENQGHSEDQIEAFDGETAALKQFCFHVRSYGTCGDFTPYVPSPTSQNHKFKKCLSHVVAEHETLAGIALKYDISGKRSIFQTFWKLHCCAKFLFFELETSNFGYLLIFSIPLTVQSFSKIGQH